MYFKWRAVAHIWTNMDVYEYLYLYIYISHIYGHKWNIWECMNAYGYSLDRTTLQAKKKKFTVHHLIRSILARKIRENFFFFFWPNVGVAHLSFSSYLRHLQSDLKVWHSNIFLSRRRYFLLLRFLLSSTSF